MRVSILALALLFGPATHALSMPMPQVQAPKDIHSVQMQCTPSSCINQRTGVYTQSTCNAYGCRPIGRPVGRLPGYGRGPDYGGGPVYGNGPVYGGRGYRGGHSGGPPPPIGYNPPRCAEC